MDRAPDRVRGSTTHHGPDMTRLVRTGVAAVSAACVLALTTTTASAQIAAAPAAPPTSVYKPLRIGGVTIAGSVRVRGEDWNWFESTGADASYAYGHTLVRLGATFSNPRGSRPGTAPSI